MTLSLHEEYLRDYTTPDALHAITPEIERAYDTLTARTGDGSDYLGWLDLPVAYDKEEFARIEAAAKKIRKTCDVFVVLGIACVVLYVVVAIVYDSNKDFDMLASYIEYASTHEVNEEYRNSLLAATDAATQVNMVAGALKNPAVNGIMGAAGAAEKLFGNKDEK